MCYSLMKQAQPTGEQHSQTNNFCSQVKFLKIKKIEFKVYYVSLFIKNSYRNVSPSRKSLHYICAAI